MTPGLSTEEAADRLREHGSNELTRSTPPSLVSDVLRAAREPLTLLLVAAAVIAGVALGEWVDTFTILAIVALNMAIGVIEERRADSALASLRALEAPTARVRRDGAVVVVPAAAVVPGDLMLVSAGERVPADARITRAAQLEVDESTLTGEALPVEKNAGDRAETSRLFAGTMVVRGEAEGEVDATGTRTVIGGVAEATSTRPPPTPLQRELARVGSRLGAGAIAVAVVAFGLTVSLSKSTSIDDAFLAAVALAVAAVPEGLATISAMTLAIGVHRMAGRGAIVRRLTAVETLGSTDVVVIDKTGTLTENRLRLESVVFGDETIDTPTGIVQREAADAVCALCNDVDAGGSDAVDVALVEAIDPGTVARWRAEWQRTAGEPFDAATAIMSAAYRSGDRWLLTAKGAPERIVARCSGLLTAAGKTDVLDEPSRAALDDRAQQLAGAGAKVLALAWASGVGPDDPAPRPTALTFVAFAVLRDRPRASARDSVAAFAGAGIRLIMATGDHPATAVAIAREVGLGDSANMVVVGPVAEVDTSATVYARALPKTKLALVDALRREGHVVAMTGDGVNDGPALRRADIGVALGQRGTDVARDAADLVVTDDDLGTVLAAVREGRGIGDNLGKVVDYLVAGNLSEIIVVMVGLLAFASSGVPLLPAQLLWVNLLTDGMPALALGVEPVDDRVLQRPPSPGGLSLVSWRHLQALAARAVVLAAPAVLGFFLSHLVWHESWATTRTFGLSLLVVTHLLYPLALSRGRRNWWLVAAVGSALLLQAVVVWWAPARSIFHTVPLDPHHWALVLTAPLAAFAVVARRVGRLPAGGIFARGTRDLRP